MTQRADFLQFQKFSSAFSVPLSGRGLSEDGSARGSCSNRLDPHFWLVSFQWPHQSFAPTALDEFQDSHSLAVCVVDDTTSRVVPHPSVLCFSKPHRLRAEYKIEKVSSTVGASVPASRLRQILDSYRVHRGNPGDGLNISEAAGAGADLFITGDKAVETLSAQPLGGIQYSFRRGHINGHRASYPTMSIATINGFPSQALDETRVVTLRGLNFEATALVFDLELSCLREDRVVWRTLVSRLGPNPTDSRPTYSKFDYHLVHCPVENVLVLSGYSRSVIISADTGRIIREVHLEFGVVSSLNFLHVQPVQSSAGGLLIASEGTMERLDRSIERLWIWDPPGPIAKCVTSPDIVAVHTFDFEEPTKLYRRTEIEIDSGTVAGFSLVATLD